MSLKILLGIGFVVLAPLLGGLLAGIDRRVSAWLQGRVGPPLLQPFYDVFKLMGKEPLVVRRSQNFYMYFFLLLIVFTGVLFFTGSDLLLVIFAFTLAAIFFALGGFKASSPYGFVGVQRELIQMMAYEPAVILAAVGLYMVHDTFSVQEIALAETSAIWQIPGIFLAFAYILLIKFRKSPFDLSMSHHAHQELVKGIITEFSGPALAAIEVAHWYENILLLGMIGLFFSGNLAGAYLAGSIVYLAAVIIDNSSARLKWRITLVSAWAITFVLGAGNVAVLYFIN